MKLLVTGGCGYKGSVLVPKLLAAGHEVVVLDTMWFGLHYDGTRDMSLISGDIRDTNLLTTIFKENKFDAVVHLAGIANDPCGELDAKLTWEVNVLGTLFLAEAAMRSGVDRFIFASSASVYGIKGNDAVVEETELTPVSDYNKTKMSAERVLLSYRDKMAIQIVRPATVCGVSPRMRFDTVVNMLTEQALRRGKIVAHCGEHGASLMRPNVHIEDITHLYCWLLKQPAKDVIYNAGFDNLSVLDTAKLIQSHIPGCEVEVTTVQDKRSYCVNSDRLLAAGFLPMRDVSDAISNIVFAYRNHGLRRRPEHTNLSWMRERGLVRDAR